MRAQQLETMKRVVTAQDVPQAGELRVPLGAIVTAFAREVAASRGVRIVELPEDQVSALAPPERTIALGADHGGFRLKEALKPLIEGLGLQVRDVGVFEEKPADYPDLALKVAELVAAGTASRGIVIDGAGIGSAIAANKVPGIRAALCYDKASARNSREHNDSNVLTLGARLITQSQAEDVLRTWLDHRFWRWAAPGAGAEDHRHRAAVPEEGRPVTPTRTGPIWLRKSARRSWRAWGRRPLHPHPKRARGSTSPTRSAPAVSSAACRPARGTRRRSSRRARTASRPANG